MNIMNLLGSAKMSNACSPVIGHGIGGKHTPINMARLAESHSLE
jgi:hypothetical protein